MRTHWFHSSLLYGLFDDYFLRLKKRGASILICPDVMFHVSIPKIIGADLVQFADEWDIKKIEYADESIQWFGCKLDGQNRTSKRCLVGKGMAVPPCCRQNLVDAILILGDICKRNNISVALSEGTLLGALKMGKVLPWERDADVSISADDFEKFLKLENHFSWKGIEIINRGLTNNLKLRSRGWDIDVIIDKSFEAHFSSGDYTRTPYNHTALTKFKRTLERHSYVKFENQWFRAPFNPGYTMMKRYGPEVYKHAEHWLATGKRSGYDKYQSGHFTECSVKGHHACLENLEADGDAAFIDI